MQTESSSPFTDFLSALVRLLGLMMLIVGLYVGIKVIFEAWSLYQEPQKIERFADAIAQGLDQKQITLPLTDSEEQQTDSPERPNTLTLQVSYFVAWFLAILLLMVIGGLASVAMRTGGQLALYDLQIKRFARLLVDEVRQSERNEAKKTMRERGYE